MARIVLPGLANGLKCPHPSTRIVSQPVPDGASQAPVSGFQVRLQARGCAAQTGGSVRKPPYTGPDGVCIW